MFKSMMSWSVAVVVAAGLAVGLSVLANAVGEANAKPQIMVSHAKGDRLAARLSGNACSPQGWPHFEPSCQFDRRRPAGAAGAARLIALR